MMPSDRIARSTGFWESHEDCADCGRVMEVGVDLAKARGGLVAGRCEPELRVEWNQTARASWVGGVANAS